jgi:hypothetical protein
VGVTYQQGPDLTIVSGTRSGPAVPLWGFVTALVVFALVYFAAPEGARPWLAAIIVLGALATQPGVVETARKKLFGG